MSPVGSWRLAHMASGRLTALITIIADEAGPGFSRSCKQGRAFGFDGKSLIHPAQIETANCSFAPSAKENCGSAALSQAAAANPWRACWRWTDACWSRLHAEDAARIHGPGRSDPKEHDRGLSRPAGGTKVPQSPIPPRRRRRKSWKPCRGRWRSTGSTFRSFQQEATARSLSLGRCGPRQIHADGFVLRGGAGFTQAQSPISTPFMMDAHGRIHADVG